MMEIIDKSTAHKMMAMIMCSIRYQDDYYLVYCIRRDKVEANVFVSKLIKGSLGYVISSSFSNGEKEVLDSVIKRLLNKENINLLEESGFYLIKDIEMDSNLSFDIDSSYVSSVSRSLIKDCLIFYDLVNEKMLEQPVIDVVEDKRKFNEGFVSSIALIILGGAVLLFSCFIIYSVLFG